MSMNLNELHKEYEKEFSEFLKHKINYAGGSLQFQHLCGLLQQLRFEIRERFGVTKSELMKFLRNHSKTFKVNSKGVVTVVTSQALNDSKHSNEEENQNAPSKERIINGSGFVFKIFLKHAIIKAVYPISSYIFFTNEDYGVDKSTLFTDIDLRLDTEVCFDAIYGHNDYEIEYRATKVWCVDYFVDKNINPVKNQNNIFSGEGVIKNLFPTLGLILVAGNENITIKFYRTNINDNSFKLGDHVLFEAEYVSKEWQATKVIRKRKNSITEPSTNSQTCTEEAAINANSTDEKIKDCSGKIYFYSKPAIIKFGENDSQIADGDICEFYLYGIRVANSDIALEFSEGDDVKFDAVKLKNSSRWKAVLVWEGKKPNSADIEKKIIEKMGENYKNENNNYSIEVPSDSSLRTTKNINKKKINTIDKECKLNTENKSQRPFSKKLNNFTEDHSVNNVVASKMISQKLSHSNSNFNRSKSKNNNKKPVNMHNEMKSFSNLTKVKNSLKNDKHSLIFEDVYSTTSEGCSETTSEENNELQDLPHCSRKFLKEDKQSSNETNLQENLEEEFYSDKENDREASNDEIIITKKKANIKILQEIEGEVAHVYCKCAIIKSNLLEREVDLVSNVLHVNGKPVDEHEVDDLKETIKVGDTVIFNCLEIIDDSGDIHRKITMAWIGVKPSVIELKPEEFILQQELKVTLDTKFSYEYESGKSFDATKNMSINETLELNSEAESALHSSLDDASYEYPMISKNETHEHPSSDTLHERLSDKIFKKLKSYGFISSKPEAVMTGIHEIIDLVLKNSIIEDSSQNQDDGIKEESVTMCSSCAKTNEIFIKEISTKDSTTQTVITGDIVHTSIFHED